MLRIKQEAESKLTCKNVLAPPQENDKRVFIEINHRTLYGCIYCTDVSQNLPLAEPLLVMESSGCTPHSSGTFDLC